MRWKEFDKYKKIVEEGKCPWCRASINKTGKQFSDIIYFLPENKKIGKKGICNSCDKVFGTPEISANSPAVAVPLLSKAVQILAS